MNAITELPSSHDAKLPQTYQNAVNALQKCSRIDECQDWANRAEAMASYARQAGDQRMRKMADRIQARAIRRCGELLKQVKPGTGKNNQYVKRAGGVPLQSRKQAGRDAGLSDRQIKTSVRVANIPEPEFEAAVESDEPPTVSKLAQHFSKPKPRGFKQATEALGTLRRFAEFCGKHNAASVANGVMEHEIEEAKSYVSVIDSWMDEFIVNIREG